MTQSVVPLAPGCPPSMGGLTQCYDDLNNASAFIAQLMIDQINNNPLVAQAMIEALTRFGYALPVLGTTNGTPAVAPQVGQYIQLSATLPYTATPAAALLSLGVLPPGDWLCWMWATFTSITSGAFYSLNPLPAGFAANPYASTNAATIPPQVILSTMPVEALTSADSLIVADTQVVASSGQSGTMTVNFAAKRTR